MFSVRGQPQETNSSDTSMLCAIARLQYRLFNLELGYCVGLSRFSGSCRHNFSRLTFISQKTRRLNYFISKVLPILKPRTHLALNLTEYLIVCSFISSLMSLPQLQTEIMAGISISLACSQQSLMK